MARVQGAQGIEDHYNVDHFLGDRRRHRRQPSGRRCQHGEDRQAHAGDNAFYGNMACTLRDHDRIADPVETVGEDHHIRRLGRGAGAARAERDPHVGRCQRRGVVDAIADHDGRMEPLLGAHGVDLVGRNTVGQHGVEIERGADRLRGGGAVASDHHDTGDTGFTQHANGARRVGAQFVGEQQCADRSFLDGDEDDERRSPRGASDRPQSPFGSVSAAQGSCRVNPR